MDWAGGSVSDGVHSDDSCEAAHHLTSDSSPLRSLNGSVCFCPLHTQNHRSALPKRHNPSAARWLTAIKKSDDRRQKAYKNE